MHKSNEALSPIVLESVEYLKPGTAIFPRGCAAEILQHVSDFGEFGGVDNGPGPFLIGVAIQRLVSNYTHDDGWKIEFLKGLFFNPNITVQTTITVHVSPEDRSIATPN